MDFHDLPDLGFLQFADSSVGVGSGSRFISKTGTWGLISVSNRTCLYRKKINHQCKWSNIVYVNRKSTRKFRNCDNSGLNPTKMHIPYQFLCFDHVSCSSLLYWLSILGLENHHRECNILLVFTFIAKYHSYKRKVGTCIGKYKSFINWFHVWSHW